MDTTPTKPDDKLPRGFMDITPRIRSTFYSGPSGSRSDTEKACLDAILNSVVQFEDGFLTCFGDNSPVVGNTLAATVDAVSLNTKSLNKSEIKDLLPKLTHVQRHAYYPGFPRFLKVQGAVVFNTWKPAQRLQVTPSDVQALVTVSAPDLASLPSDTSRRGAVEALEPRVWSILMKMLFGNEDSAHKSDAWQDERWIFTQWTSCVVIKPLSRPLWAPVLRSDHGIGKGTFEHLMRCLMGSAAVNTVANIEGLTSTHNGDAALTRLLVLNEVLQKGKDTKADQRLKMFISDPVIEINRKHEQRFFTLATHATILYSNSPQPFLIPKTERRYWVPEFRKYDVGEEHGLAFHAEGARHVRSLLENPAVIHELLCWLSLVSELLPRDFTSTAPASLGVSDMHDHVSDDRYEDLCAFLTGLDRRGAVTLAQVTETSRLGQTVVLDTFKRHGLRNCQMRSEGNRKVWTKAPAGSSPQDLRSYNPS